MKIFTKLVIFLFAAIYTVIFASGIWKYIQYHISSFHNNKFDILITDAIFVCIICMIIAVRKELSNEKAN